MAASILAALLAFLAPQAAGQETRRRVAILIEDSAGPNRQMIDVISAGVRDQAVVAVFELGRIATDDPIQKGKLVASLQDRALVVAVGDEATGFVSREVEETKVYFVGAGLVDGPWLRSASSAGLFSYNVDALLDAIGRLWPGTIGLAFTPGYEPVAGWIRGGAAARGLRLIALSVPDIRSVAPGIRDLLDRSSALLIVGDPLLARGPGFEFLRERALSLRIPVIAAGKWEVENGAMLAFESEPAALASQASRNIAAILRGRAGAPLEPGPRSGTFLLNGVLADKWKVAQAPGDHWRVLRP